MSFRFIHSSDLHIGRKFTTIPEPPDGNIRGRLMEARHTAIARLADAARQHGAGDILLAGDTFDTATPSASVIRQTLSTMAEASHVTWWILPGNHDNLRDGEPLWAEVLGHAPPNLRLITEAAPLEIAPQVTLLPCPIRYRASGSDPTAILPQMPSPEGHFRLGLAHGGVTDFTESGELIAPDRDQSARLDYLALGDWHGRIAVSDRVHYSGTPEQDRFKHGSPAVCLAVNLTSPGAKPVVEDIPTGSFQWSERELTLYPGQKAAAALQAILPASARRNNLLQIRALGWASLEDRAKLQAAIRDIAPEFAHLALRDEGLSTQYDPQDLDQIDRPGGALRSAADALLSQAQDPSFAEADRKAAGDALARLYAYVKEADL